MASNENRDKTHAIESHLTIVLAHLLKWRYQPQRRGKSWRRSVLIGRQHIARRLKRNPSLRPRLPFFLVDAYHDAQALAESDTGLPFDTFPERCPWSLDDVLDPKFFPEA